MKYICSNCIGDRVIKKEVIDSDNIETCSYCEEEGQCISLNDLALRVDEVYREYYQLGAVIPHFSDDSDKPDYRTLGEEPSFILQEVLEIECNIADDLVKILSDWEEHDVVHDGADPLFDSASNYEAKPTYDYEYSGLWNEFCDSIKHKSRFFDVNSIRLLDEIFKDIDKYEYSGEKPPIRIFGDSDDEKYIYRGRRADTDQKIINILKNPQKELGPPPKKLATAGRMNPDGISVFYGALNRKTCLAELRLPVGSYAITGKFEVIGKLIVLDLTLLNKIYEYLSMFDTNYVSKLNRIQFLQNFKYELSKPVLPYDEYLEYLPTQALIEYLGNYYKPRIDAVIFPSVQEGNNNNIVILNHAATVESAVEPISDTDKNKYRIFMNGNSISIWRSKELNDLNYNKENDIFLSDNNENYLEKTNNPSNLRFVPNSLKVHKISSISIFSENYVYYEKNS